MNVGTQVINALAPKFGQTVRWRRATFDETRDGGVTPIWDAIPDLPDDGKVIAYAIDERKRQQLFGAASRASAVAVVTTTLAASLTGSVVMQVMDGVMAGTCYEVKGRQITEAGELGGCVILGLEAPSSPPQQAWT